MDTRRECAVWTQDVRGLGTQETGDIVYGYGVEGWGGWAVCLLFPCLWYLKGRGRVVMEVEAKCL
jgi:spore germination protein YaaH